MKKLLIALLIALLVVPGTLLATEGEYSTYTATDYSVSYPSDWQVLDRDTIDSVIGMVTSGEIEGMDTSILSQYKAQIEATDMAIIMTQDGSINFNITTQPVGMAIDADMVLSSLVPMLTAQLGEMLPGFEVVDAGTQYTAGDNEYVKVVGQYELQGIPMEITQLLYPHGTSLTTLTYTVTDSADAAAAGEILEAVAASLKTND